MKILPMTRAHVRACEEIVSASDPWKRLGERVDFTQALSRKPFSGEAYVCAVDGRAAGFIVFTPEPVFARGGYLRAIGVAPGMQRRGIGGKLLSFAEKAVSRRAPHFYLCVSSFNRKAQAFYAQQGYRRIGKIPGLLVPGASEYIYWKRLSPLSHTTRRVEPC
jgi:ribosomal protein S18 acetylase RimI-like enzyme